VSPIGSNRGDEPSARSRSLLLEEKFPPCTEYKGRSSRVSIALLTLSNTNLKPTHPHLVCVGPCGDGVYGGGRRDGDGLMLLCVLVIKTGLTKLCVAKNT